MVLKRVQEHIGEIRSELLKTEREIKLVTARPFSNVGAYAVTLSNNLSRSTTPISWEASVHSMARYSSDVIWAECCRLRRESFSGRNRFSDKFPNFGNSS